MWLTLNADNYDMHAEYDDGGCIYYQCMDATACNTMKRPTRTMVLASTLWKATTATTLLGR